MARLDPLPALTLLGLLGCALLATLHPTEAFDAGGAAKQAGRTVAVSLLVVQVKAGDGWVRGTAWPTGDAGAGPVEWMWFRPPAALPLSGDRLDGRAKVDRAGAGFMLVLDGERAAFVTAGPHPVAVRWSDLVGRPEQYEGRLLVVSGVVEAGWLVGPEGHACALADEAAAGPVGGRTVRLVRSADRPGWLCDLGAPR